MTNVSKGIHSSSEIEEESQQTYLWIVVSCNCLVNAGGCCIIFTNNSLHIVGEHWTVLISLDVDAHGCL